MRKCTYETFLKDTSEHEMIVVKDDDLHRHLQFRNPKGSFYWFDIITWPGHLCVQGDMGCYVFSRIEDMFRFFRQPQSDKQLSINESYWGEKLQTHSGYKTYSDDIYKELVKEWTESVLDERWGKLGDASEEVIAEFRREVQDQLFWSGRNSHEEAHATLREFKFEHYDKETNRLTYEVDIRDTWEWNFDDYDYRFVWNLWAIVHAIRQYDSATQLSMTKPISFSKA